MPISLTFIYIYTACYVTAEVAEDQKKFYDILVISNPFKAIPEKSYLPLILIY